MDARREPEAPRGPRGADFGPLFIVARGHQDLVGPVKVLLASVGPYRVIEDRRQDRSLFPREGREGHWRTE